MKKSFGLILILVFILSFAYILPPTPVASASPATVDKAYVQQKINSLKELFPTGSYFTNDGNACLASENSTGKLSSWVSGGKTYYTCQGRCTSCRLSNVLANNKNAIKAKEQSPGLANVRGSRYSCCGFAAFAFSYIFEHDLDNNTSSISTGNSGITHEFLSQLLPGDVVFCYTSFSASSASHYAIFLGYDGSNVYFYESNFDSPSQVEYYHARKRNADGTKLKPDGSKNQWVKLVAYRSNKHTTKFGTTSGSDNIGTPTNAVYLVGAPDGFQALRTGASTSYSKICNVPNGTYITVTKIAND